MMADDVPEGDVDVDVEEKQREEVMRSTDDKQVVVRLSHSVLSPPLPSMDRIPYCLSIHTHCMYTLYSHQALR